MAYFTVFTPTYNRGKCLSQLYKSLSNQSFNDFVWMIVDDGSTDDTTNIVENFQEKSAFNIEYYYQENGGKHRAINKGVSLASSKFFFIVDSDDELTDDSLSTAYEWCQEIENNKRFAGVSGLRMTREGNLLGGTGKGKGVIDCTNLDRKKLDLLGDKAEIYKTAILKQYPFKEFDHEKFLTEETVWNRIAEDGYMVRWHMKPIYKCDYLQGGLTDTVGEQQLECFEGFTYETTEALRLKGVSSRINAIYKYQKVALKKKLTDRDICKRLHISKFDLLGSVVIGKIYYRFKNAE